MTDNTITISVDVEDEAYFRIETMLDALFAADSNPNPSEVIPLMHQSLSADEMSAIAYSEMADMFLQRAALA